MISIFLVFVLGNLDFLNLESPFPEKSGSLFGNTIFNYFLFFVVLSLIAWGFFISTNGPLIPDQSNAELEKLSNEELRQVSGKNLLNFVVEKGQTDVSGSIYTNQSCGFCDGCSPHTYDYRVNNSTGERTTHFTRLEIDARLEINPSNDSHDGIEIGQAQIGHYDDNNTIGNANGGYITGTAEGTAGQSFYWGPHFTSYGGCHQDDCSTQEGANTWDLQSNGIVLQPGSESGCSGADCIGDSLDVVIQDPYLELAWEDFATGDGEASKLVGVRFGVEKMKGSASLQSLNKISGTIRAQDFGNNGACHASGHRITDCPTYGGANALGLFNKAAFGGGTGSTWGDNDEWTEDFWFSFNRKDLFWRHQNPEAGNTNADEVRFHTDGEGFWIHATDEVQGGVS